MHERTFNKEDAFNLHIEGLLTMEVLSTYNMVKNLPMGEFLFTRALLSYEWKKTFNYKNTFHLCILGECLKKCFFKLCVRELFTRGLLFIPCMGKFNYTSILCLIDENTLNYSIPMPTTG